MGILPMAFWVASTAYSYACSVHSSSNWLLTKRVLQDAKFLLMRKFAARGPHPWPWAEERSTYARQASKSL